MNERGFSTVSTVLLAALAALLVAPFLMTWVVVDVKTAPPDDVHVKLPVPLGAVRVALALMPDRATRAEVPGDVAVHLDQARAVLRELDAAPDATFLTVKAPGSDVRIAKEGGILVLDVKDDGEKVACRLPVAAVRAALEEWDGRTLDARALLDILAKARGPLIEVDSKDAKVRIAMW